MPNTGLPRADRLANTALVLIALLLGMVASPCPPDPAAKENYTVTVDLVLENDDLRLDFRITPDGHYRITDLRSGEVYAAPDLGVVRAWDRTEDRLRPELVIPDPERRKVVAVEKLSGTSAVIHVDLGGSGSASPMEPIGLGVQFDVAIELRANTVELAIPEETLEERLSDRYALFSIELLPNLGATPRGSQGYLFIPSWSGAVYHFDRQHPQANPKLADRGAFGVATEEGIQRRWGHPADAPAEYGSLVYGEQAKWEDQLQLPVYATVRDGAALAGILIGGAYDTELIAKRDQGLERLASTHPRFHYRYFWHSKRDTESRRVRLIFLRGEKASWQGVANLYRDFLLKEQGVKTLRERAAENDSIRYFIQSVYVRVMFGMTHGGVPKCYQSFGDLADVIPLFKEAGFDKVSFIGVGANLGGHDWAHPTIFPFEPAYGGEEGFKHLIETVYAHGYTLGLHTNYKDVYRHSPDWNEDAIQRNEWGELRYHGAWMGGWSYQGIPHRMLELYVKRDFPKLRAMGLSGFWYFDAVGGVMEEAFAPGERICRREYGEGMNAYFAEANRVFGCCGNEVSIAPSLGILVDTNIHWKGGGGPVSPDENGFTAHGLLDRFVPFQHMVYHGICGYGGGPEVGGRVGTEYWKQPTREEIQELYARWKASQDWREDLEYEFLVGYEELAGGVSRSRFSDGTEILVNRTAGDWKGEGITVPTKGYVVKRGK